MTQGNMEEILRRIVKTSTNTASRNEWIEIQNENVESIYDYRYDHVEFVVNMAKHIAMQVGADMEVVTLASWLHDIAKPGMGGVRKHGEISAEMAREILLQHDIDEAIIDRVCEVIRKHVGLTLEAPIEPIEAGVLWDADKILKLGAIGFVHFLVNGIKLNPGTKLDSAAHNLRKFIPVAQQIVESMNTSIGREMANKRLQTLIAISEQLDEEINLIK
jgi:uncharacterized protein